jgi:hypothetical protein
MADDNGCLQTGDLLIQGVQLREQSTESLTCVWRQRVGIFFKEQRSELADTPDTCGATMPNSAK